MPTVNVRRDLLFAQIGRTFTDDEFDALCFQFGIELDSITSEKEILSKQTAGDSSSSSSSSVIDAADDSVLYKIEIPANRYDLLCVEGLSRALRVFLSLESAPQYRVVVPAPDKILRIVQKKETLSVRPFVVGAVLRNLSFNADSFASFIDLQDKLHQNIGRKRTLVAIGTHDLDTIQAPFSYEALPKKEIKFVPLAEEKEMDGEELFAHYNSKPNCHLKPYLYITEHSPLHPVIYDSARVVCSLPPIINGEHSKITLNTRNVFIECTGTDATKLSVTLNQVVTMFAQYCQNPHEVEGVEVVSPEGKSEIFPQLQSFPFVANVNYVNSAIGIKVTAEQMVGYLKKMSMEASISADGENLDVLVPPTRSDILHACDIMEDIAISYGFNKVPRTLPQCYTQGKFNRLNSLSDSIREQIAQAGFNEVLTWVLLSFDDNYRFMQPKDVKGTVLNIKAAQASAQAGSSVSGLLENKAPLIVHPLLASPKAITLADPKSLDFQLVRTTLLPGLLKALSNNQGQVNLPIKLFECGDIGFQDESSDVGARNQRRVSAIYCDVRSGFEEMQGLLERIMTINGIYFAPTVAEYKATRAKAQEKKEAARKVLEAAEKKKAAAKAKAAKGAKAGEEKKEEAAPAPASVDDAHEEAEWKVVDTFSLRRSSHPSFFPGRCADIVLHRLAQKDELVIGSFGILHPDVINQFGIPYVCSALEINIEYFL